MIRPKILVTGATGKTGAVVADLLLERGYPVRALVRKLDARSERLARLGAEIAVADLADPEGLIEAMRGTARAYYCPPMDPYMIQTATAFAVAAREANLEAIVNLGQWTASPNHPSNLTRQNWLADKMFAMLPGIAYTAVTPGYFADNDLRLIDFASLLGIFPVLNGRSLDAPASNEDIARVVVEALIAPDRHAGKRYRPTGPALISGYDIAATFARVLGNGVRPLPMPFWMFARAARIQGENEFVVDSLRHYIKDHQAGAFAVGAPTNDVLEVTGRPAEDFETTARRYAAKPFARKTPANRLRALMNFGLVPIWPGFDFGSLARRLGQPILANPQQCMDSARWRAEHEPQQIADATPSALADIGLNHVIHA